MITFPGRLAACQARAQQQQQHRLYHTSTAVVPCIIPSIYLTDNSSCIVLACFVLLVALVERTLCAKAPYRRLGTTYDGTTREHALSGHS